MSIEAISNALVAIYLDTDDLISMGLNASISGRTARILVVDYLKKKGENPWPRMEIELFSSSGALLLLARPSSGEIHVFRFTDVEALIESVLSFTCDPPSTLTYFRDDYYLSVCLDVNALPCALYEYGEYFPLESGFLTHISEHGKTIIPDLAISVMRDYFQ